MYMVEASADWLLELDEYMQECAANGLVRYTDKDRSPGEFLEDVLIESNQACIPQHRVPCKTYFCIDSGNIVGTIRERIGENETIVHSIGHVGYETRPSARNRGVAQFMLAWLKGHGNLSSYIVTCCADNHPSIHVIEHCGGQWINDVEHPDVGTIRRYILHA